jgi:hypothetical protein
MKRWIDATVSPWQLNVRRASGLSGAAPTRVIHGENGVVF